MEIFEKIDTEKFSDEDIDILVEKVKNKTLACHNMVDVDGDHRFWGVDISQSSILERFHELAEKCYVDQNGVAPKYIILMINFLRSEVTLNGSGGGWHVDSVADQYKLFMYLEDCLDVSNGPLALCFSGVRWIDKIVIKLNYVIKSPFGKKFRFSDKFINVLTKIRFLIFPVLEKKGTPFFVNTSYVHRGLPISNGERLMVTAYMFDRIPPSIAKRIYD